MEGLEVAVPAVALNFGWPSSGGNLPQVAGK
jgi:hypothetical protein